MPVLVGAAPADAVPQYWHRAAGFDDMFIAHAESKHRVKFAREHAAGAAFSAPGTENIIAVKYKICVFISLCLGFIITKINLYAKGKNKKSVDKIKLLSIIGV